MIGATVVSAAGVSPWVVYVVALAAFLLGIMAALWVTDHKGTKRAFQERDREEALRSHIHHAVLRGTTVKAEPLYEDDEETESFDISLQVYGDLDEDRSVASAISFALTQWLRSGAQCGGFTATNGLRIHMISRGEQGEMSEDHKTLPFRLATQSVEVSEGMLSVEPVISLFEMNYDRKIVVVATQGSKSARRTIDLVQFNDLRVGREVIIKAAIAAAKEEAVAELGAEIGG